MNLLLYLFDLVNYGSHRNVTGCLHLDGNLLVMNDVSGSVDLNEIGLLDEGRHVNGVGLRMDVMYDIVHHQVHLFRHLNRILHPHNLLPQHLNLLGHLNILDRLRPWYLPHHLYFYRFLYPHFNYFRYSDSLNNRLLLLDYLWHFNDSLD